VPDAVVAVVGGAAARARFPVGVLVLAADRGPVPAGLDPGLVDRVVRIAGCPPGLRSLKADALVTEQDPKALVGDVVDTPSATRKSASFYRLQVENGRPCSTGVPAG